MSRRMEYDRNPSSNRNPTHSNSARKRRIGAAPTAPYIRELRQITERTRTAATPPARIRHLQGSRTQKSYQGRRVGTGDIKHHSQEKLITRPVSQFLKTSAPNCETATLHTKSSAWSVNNTRDVRNTYAETNGKLRRLTITTQQKPQLTTHLKDEHQDPY